MIKRIQLGLLATLVVLTLCSAAAAQKHSPFEDIGEGFKLSRFESEAGHQSLLVLFPEEYLKDTEAIAKGTWKALSIIFGCDFFPECKPQATGVGMDEDGLAVVWFNTTDPAIQLVVQGLGDDNKKFIGIIVSRARPKPQAPPVPSTD